MTTKHEEGGGIRALVVRPSGGTFFAAFLACHHASPIFTSLRRTQPIAMSTCCKGYMDNNNNLCVIGVGGGVVMKVPLFSSINNFFSGLCIEIRCSFFHFNHVLLKM